MSEPAFPDLRDARRRALTALLRITPWGQQAMENMSEYLDSAADIPIEEYEHACRVLRDTWSEGNRSPLPGDIRRCANLFARKSRSEMRGEADRQRMQHAYRSRMTPDKIRAELANPQFVDPDPAIETKRIESLKRILVGQTTPPRVRKRGDGGLQPLGVVVEGVL